jgi:hypothetical protein
MELPILCTLTPAELAERKRSILDSIAKTVVRADRLPNGWAYEFPPTPSMLAELNHALELERQCCRFLDFRIVESATAIRLEVTGSPEATAIVADFFGPSTL